MGMAYLKYKQQKSRIFIIRIEDSSPKGFLNGIQAESYNDRNFMNKIAKKIDKEFNTNILSTIKQNNQNIIDSKIKELYNVNSFKKAENLLNYINDHSKNLTKEQLNMICNASIINDQIYKCYICKKPLNEILFNNKEKIDNNTYQDVFKKINNME